VLRILSIVIFLIVIFSNITQAREVDYASLHVRVEGIRNYKGEVGVALFDSPKGYPTHSEHCYEAEWVELRKGMKDVDVEFEGLPFGEYAISVLHDENGTRRLERNVFGFPREGVGFSNEQKVKLSAPKFKKAKFELSEAKDKLIVIQLDYRE